MTDQGTHQAGLFDLRRIIALLFAVYGVVLVVVGFNATDAERAKAGGININLWSGVGMLVLAAVFAVWSVTRPLKVPDHPEELGGPADGSAAADEH